MTPGYDCSGCGAEECQDCCTHDDVDHGVCMYCQKDMPFPEPDSWDMER